MTSDSWLLKIKRYDHSESVLQHSNDKDALEAEAKRRNTEYQSALYYVEKYEDTKFEWPGITH